LFESVWIQYAKSVKEIRKEEEKEKYKLGLGEPFGPVWRSSRGPTHIFPEPFPPLPLTGGARLSSSISSRSLAGVKPEQ
jgi:hypothetical protein